MLSAVAARKAKAAQVSSASCSSKPPSPPPPSKSPSLSPQPPKASNKPASKRKPRVSANAGPPKNKKIKIAHAPAKSDQNARYFNPSSTSDARHNAIDTVTDSTSRIELDSESDSDSSQEEMEMEMDVPPPVIGLSSTSIAKTKRPWSPSQPVPDSSDDDEPGPSSYLTLSTSKQFDSFPLSTFRPVPDHNVFPVPEDETGSSGKARILVFQPNETLALVGVYSFCVLQGSISLLGVTLSPSNTRHTVFAPRSSPLPVLSWATSTRRGSCTFPIPPSVRQQADTAAILIEYADTGVEGLGRICKIFDNVFRPPRAPEASTSVDISRICIVNHSTKDIRPFVLPSSWEVAIASLENRSDPEMGYAPICLVKGPKKSGKSTLARTLVNRLLTRYRRVTFLECDLGQSEFTPGGLVALNLVENYIFGPPFTHPTLPYRAHYIGSISPRASPSHYLHSIQSLLETYKLNLQFPALIDDPPPDDERIYDVIPLVVNTMGWNKGLGADLNARIEEFVEASHTFDIGGAEEKTPQPRHVPQLQSSIATPFVQIDKRHLEVEPFQTEMANMYHTATDHRHLNILSYFHAIFPESPIPSSLGPSLKQITATSWDTSLPLCARYPYEVDYTQAFDRVYLTGAGYEDIVPSELARVLNGAIVGLVSGSPTGTFSRPMQSTTQESALPPYTPGEPPPDPMLSMCHGLTLIRGLPPTPSPHSPYMHVLTPLPTGLLGQARILVKGEMELPVWGMLDFREDDQGRVAGIERAHVPYLQWGKGEGIGGEKRRVRRNLMRKGQM